MLPESPFDELLREARGGASWALADLWRALSPAVAAFLGTRGASEPEEATSEVFLAAFRSLPRFKGGEAEFRSLVFTIARRRLVDDHRRRGRRPAVLPWAAKDDERTVHSAEEAVLVRDGAERARNMLDALSPDQRDVLVLRILGDLTVEQVAHVLGKSEGAVKQLQRRGLEALRRVHDSRLAVEDVGPPRPSQEGM